MPEPKAEAEATGWGSKTLAGEHDPHPARKSAPTPPFRGIQGEVVRAAHEIRSPTRSGAAGFICDSPDGRGMTTMQLPRRQFLRLAAAAAFPAAMTSTADADCIAATIRGSRRT